MTTGPENPYGEQQPPQNPYYPQQQPPQPGYYQQPQQPPYGYPQQPPYGYQQPPPPNHPSATTSMVLGIIGLAGLLTCGGITLLLSPFAWITGAKAVREIKANPGTYSGESSATAGKVMGIIGTIILVLGILALVAFIVWAVTYDATLLEDPDGTGY